MATNNPRPDPVIPDHEVLRKVGGGAYGEVWLARGVTGALRAVKVVYREDFDDVRGFEREFEGILKFEPISRDHPGLVNILHVGRSPDFSFYYYVMELGDDVTTGREINPIEYEARTLRSDTKRTPGRRLPTEHAIDCGVRLAEALKHLHDNGLAHRDVKPANVIFVNGKAKLADIGLVATRGQRTFVGTEGFVPPEGPGSAQADVYSLGKVLYEMATGKDRLDFPELPDELPSGPERKRWLALNQIICDICEPQLSKRKISTATDLSDSLKRLQQGKRRRRRRPVGAFFVTLFIGGLLGLMGWHALQKSSFGQQFKEQMAALVGDEERGAPPKPTNGTKIETPKKVVPKKVLVKISSGPSGAEVFKPNGVKIGDTNCDYLGDVGEKVSFVLKLEGYKAAPTEERILTGDEDVVTLYVELTNSSPPVTEVPWKDQLHQSYRPIPAPRESDQQPLPGDFHETNQAVEKGAWEVYASAKGRPPEVAEFLETDGPAGKSTVALTTEAEAKEFCAWLLEDGSGKGFFTEQHEVTPVMQADFNDPAMSERAKNEGLRPFLCRVRTVPYARIEIKTEPSGGEVYVSQGDIGWLSKGVTTDSAALPIPELTPGETSISIVLEGYKVFNETFTLKPGEVKSITRKLVRIPRVDMEKPWENKLHMRFVPVAGAKDLMACVWETRVQDYRQYITEEGKIMPSSPNFAPEDRDLHPMVNVSREDAVLFCKWLTAHEWGKDQEQQQEPERHASSYAFRLPSDYEWSLMAGVTEDPLRSPAWKDNNQSQVQQFSPLFPQLPPPPPHYLWGTDFPPPNNYANLADASAANGTLSSARTIPSYHDPFRNTAPVGSFAPFNGIYDLCGNVNEWVSDNYRSSDDPVPLGVLRGGAWNTYQAPNLEVTFRSVVPPTYLDDACGFRVMLSKVPAVTEEKPTDKPPEKPIEKPTEETLPDHG
jgi:serine/threonine protein kinase